MTGTRPPPCDDFTFTMVDDRRVLLFGGDLDIGVSGDAYIIIRHGKNGMINVETKLCMLCVLSDVGYY